MERDLAGVALTEQDFHRLALLCQGDPKFPPSYARWLDLVRDGTRQLLAKGEQVEDIALDVGDFASWCTRVSLHPGLDALRAYLIIGRRHRASSAGTGTSAGKATSAPHRRKRSAAGKAS